MEPEGMGLQLFDLDEFNTGKEKKVLPVVTEEIVVAPLQEVLENATPTSQPKEVSQSLSKSLEDLFPEQQYDEKNIQRAKEMLGATASELTPEQFKNTVTEMQYLCESWLDEFERGIFKGMTLNELLHEKGGR